MYWFCFEWTHNQHVTCRRLLCKFRMFGRAVHLWMDEVGFKSAVNDDSQRGFRINCKPGQLKSELLNLYPVMTVDLHCDLT